AHRPGRCLRAPPRQRYRDVAGDDDVRALALHGGLQRQKAVERLAHGRGPFGHHARLCDQPALRFVKLDQSFQVGAVECRKKALERVRVCFFFQFPLSSEAPPTPSVSAACAPSRRWGGKKTPPRFFPPRAPGGEDRALERAPRGVAAFVAAPEEVANSPRPR